MPTSSLYPVALAFLKKPENFQELVEFVLQGTHRHGSSSFHASGPTRLWSPRTMAYLLAGLYLEWHKTPEHFGSPITDECLLAFPFNQEKPQDHGFLEGFSPYPPFSSSANLPKPNYLKPGNDGMWYVGELVDYLVPLWPVVFTFLHNQVENEGLQGLVDLSLHQKVPMCKTL